MANILKNASMPDLASAADLNMLNFIYEIYHHFFRMELVIDPNLCGLLPDRGSDFINIIFQTGFSPEQLDEKIKFVIQRSHLKNPLPILWLISPTSKPENLGEYLEKNGFQKSSSVLTMAVAFGKLNLSLDLPQNVVIERVQNFALLKQWMDIVEAGYSFSEGDRKAYSAYFQELGFGDDVPTQLFLGFIDGQPAATSQVFFGGAAAGIYKVAVLPSMRRQGLGSAMTITAARAGLACGYPVGLLFATEEGVPLYHHLGFEAFYPYQEYIFEETKA